MKRVAIAIVSYLFVFSRDNVLSAQRTATSTSRRSSKRRPGKLSPPSRRRQPADSCASSAAFNRRSTSSINQSTICSTLSRHHPGPQAFISAIRLEHPQPGLMFSPVMVLRRRWRWVPAPGGIGGGGPDGFLFGSEGERLAGQFFTVGVLRGCLGCGRSCQPQSRHVQPVPSGSNSQ